MLALTRSISDKIGHCQLTHLERHPIDLTRARLQHAAYEEALRHCGCQVLQLDTGPDLPDSVFIEDTAVVVEELAVITRPGAPSRQPETTAVARALEQYRPTCEIKAPAVLDGGDVLRVGRRIFVGISRRSNQAGVAQLSQAVSPLGYRVHPVEMGACLHLKTAVTQVGERLLLVNPEWVDPSIFGLPWLAIDPDEPMAANALWLPSAVVYPQAFSKTARRLEAAGIGLVRVAADELAKAEGGVTCCSLLLSQATLSIQR